MWNQVESRSDWKACKEGIQTALGDHKVFMSKRSRSFESFGGDLTYFLPTKAARLAQGDQVGKVSDGSADESVRSETKNSKKLLALASTKISDIFPIYSSTYSNLRGHQGVLE